MKLLISLEIDVEASTDDEIEDAERIRAQIDRDSMRSIERAVSMDESLMQDFYRILGDIRQLADRANARLRTKD